MSGKLQRDLFIILENKNKIMKPVANNNLIKSKKRVADHGEVFTSEREVNAMLDLVDRGIDFGIVDL